MTKGSSGEPEADGPESGVVNKESAKYNDGSKGRTGTGTLSEVPSETRRGKGWLWAPLLLVALVQVVLLLGVDRLVRSSLETIWVPL